MEMEGLGLHRQSSIENEPRTLNIHQMDFARDAALYVMNNRSIEEAVRIFTEGLEPVLRCAEGGGVTNIDGDDVEDQNCGKDDRTFRDIVSAPF